MVTLWCRDPAPRQGQGDERPAPVPISAIELSRRDCGHVRFRACPVCSLLPFACCRLLLVQGSTWAAKAGRRFLARSCGTSAPRHQIGSRDSQVGRGAQPRCSSTPSPSCYCSSFSVATATKSPTFCIQVTWEEEAGKFCAQGTASASSRVASGRTRADFKEGLESATSIYRAQ